MRLLLLSLLVLGSCSSDEAPAADQARYERLSLRPERARPRPAAKVVRAFTPTLEGSGWTVESETKRIVTHGSALALHLRGTEPRQVKVDAGIALSAFNRVRLHAIFGGRLELELRLVRSGQVAWRQSQNVNAGLGPQALNFDLPWSFERSGRLDHIELGVRGGGPFDLLAFELLASPIAEWLPLPEDGPDMVSIENESRRGVGLVPTCPLVGEVEVTDATERLGFAIGKPPRLETGVKGVQVLVTVGEGAGSLVQQVRVPDKQQWLHTTLSLAPFVGRSVPVRFEIQGAKGVPTACALANVELMRPGAPAPSIVLISSDTHRADHLGIAPGDVEVDTPELDELATRGVLFEDAWSTTNVTSPSHVALMTGIHPRDSRVIANTGHLAEEAATLAEAFADEGWTTLGVVSVRHLGPRGIGLGQGFDRMRDPPGEPWDAVNAVDFLLHYVEETSGSPTFAWLHLFDAHDPYAPPEDYDRRYYPKGKNPYDTSLPEPGWQVGSYPLHLTPVRDTAFPAAQYRAEVAYLDEQLGRVFRHGRLKDGWFAFTSDHGEILETQGSWYNHGELFPATLHVPLILAGPEVPIGERCEAMVRQADLGRTLLDVAGLGGVEFPGTNLLAEISKSKDDGGPRFALSAGGFSAAVTDGRWFLVLTLKEHSSMLPRARASHEVELYDLAADPECQQPVDDAARTRALRSQLIAWLEDASEESFAGHKPISAEELASLAALGYAGDMPEIGARRWIDPDCACEHCVPWR